MKFALIALIGIVFLLGCVNSPTGSSNTCGNYDNNSACVPADINRTACNIDSNVPTCTSGNSFPSGNTIPYIDPNSIPYLPNTPVQTTPGGQNDDEEMTEEEYQGLKEKPVTVTACEGLQYETFINAYIQYIPAAAQAGVSYEFMGVVEYRDAFWCSYNVKNEKEQAKITHYANPYTHEVWQVVQDDGKTAELHIEHDMIVEVCSDGICQPMFPGA